MAQKQLQAGDCIEIFRGQYQHWALCVGDFCVIHLAPPSEIPQAGFSSVMSVLTNKAVVKMDGLWDVVGNSKWRVNNNMDRKYKPRPVHAILRDAISRVGVELPYSITTSNCEHFVNELRYGKAESQQVAKVEQIALVTGLGFLALSAAFSSGKKREESEEQ